MFFAVANTFANTFYMQTNGFGKLHWYLNHSHSCGLNRVIRVYHYPVLQVMAERPFHKSDESGESCPIAVRGCRYLHGSLPCRVRVLPYNRQVRP